MKELSATAFATQTQGTAAPAPTSGGFAAWLPHRTIQALRQSPLQMPAGTWPWAEILPVHEPSGNHSAHGLRPAELSRASRALLGKLPPGARSPQGNLRHQQRTLAAARAILRRSHAPEGNAGRHPVRPPRVGHARGQYARSVPRCRCASGSPQGGVR